MPDRSALSVIGLGKLGLPLAAHLASHDFEVIGLDIRQPWVTAIQSGECPIPEPGLAGLLKNTLGRNLRITTEYQDAVYNSDISFVIVPTPSQASGEFSNEFVLSAVEHLGRALRQKPEWHLVVITSTVMPGACQGAIRHTLERCSGRKVGHDVGLCYSPEFIALGTVLLNMSQPDMLLIGESDSRSGETLEQVLRLTTDNGAPVERMNLVNAEIAKIAVNTYVTMKISYANTLAQICEERPGADAGVVTRAVGLDSRIGRKYLRPGTAYGGPCFPRDTRAFASLGYDDLALATERVNHAQVERLADLATQRGQAIGILGVAYKPGTPISEESTGLALAKLLVEEGFQVAVWDPKADRLARPKGVAWADSAQDCVNRSDVVVITTAWPEFADLDYSLTQVIDCWNLSRSNAYQVGKG